MESCAVTCFLLFTILSSFCVSEVYARKFLTRKEIDELLLPHCAKHVLKPEDYPRIPELSLKNAIEPKCLQRCLETFGRINYASCRAMRECSDCMVPCLAEGTYHRDCEDVCSGGSSNWGRSTAAIARHASEASANKIPKPSAPSPVSEACVESCEYYKMFYEQKSHLQCPTPYDVSWEDHNFRDVCPDMSECFFDTQCKLKSHKCCPCRTEALFCVDMSSTGNHSALALVDPDSRIDAFFNFAVNAQQNDGTLVLQYRLPNRTLLEMLPETYTVALFVWRTFQNFVEEPNYRFSAYSSLATGTFTYSMLPGFSYRFKMGIYDEYGLIGTKLDNLRNNTAFEMKRLPVIKKVPKLRLDEISCKRDVSYLNPTCHISLSWGTVPDNDYPLLYNLQISSCLPNKIEPTPYSRVSGIRINVCGGSFNVTIHAAATVVFINGSTTYVYSQKRTFPFTLAKKSDCKDGANQGHPVAQAVPVRIPDNEKTQVMRFEVNDTAMASFNSFRKKHDWLYVRISSRFCMCEHEDMYCGTEQEMEFSVDFLQGKEFEVDLNTGYSITLYLSSYKNKQLCYPIHVQNKPPKEYISSKLELELKHHLPKVFPLNTGPLNFPGKMKLDFWSMEHMNIDNSMELRDYDFPVKFLPFVTKCSSQLFVTVWYDPLDMGGIENPYPACADAGYLFPVQLVVDCLTDEEYFMYFHPSRPPSSSSLDDPNLPSLCTIISANFLLRLLLF